MEKIPIVFTERYDPKTSNSVLVFVVSKTTITRNETEEIITHSKKSITVPKSGLYQYLSQLAENKPCIIFDEGNLDLSSIPKDQAIFIGDKTANEYHFEKQYDHAVFYNSPCSAIFESMYLKPIAYGKDLWDEHLRKSASSMDDFLNFIELQPPTIKEMIKDHLKKKSHLVKSYVTECFQQSKIIIFSLRGESMKHIEQYITAFMNDSFDFSNVVIIGNIALPK